jgi:uncharacterized repeat protein (TIGR01451 family)
MLRTLSLRLAAVATIVASVAAPSALNAQKALVYCPVGIDAGGCTTIVAALNADPTRFPDGADAGYDGTQGTLDLATADFSSYAVLVVPSLADGPDAQPYALLRNGTIAARLQAAFVGRVAVWSGTPDIGTTNRSSKDALIRNLAGWARPDAAGTHGPGVVALQDNSDAPSARYGWLGSISALSVTADTTFDVYANVQALTSTGQTIVTNGGLQLGYTNMASFGLLAGPGGRNDATGDRSSRVVLVTAAGEAADATVATVSTDKDDYTPGDTVTVTGTGWEPGETVSLLFHEDANPPIHPDKTLNAVADELGHIFNHEYDIDSTDIGIRFTLTATGQTSGRTAQATFTDNKTLTVALTGGGLGTVTGGEGSPAAGINCPGDCTESVDNNANITLTATPAGPSTIGTWSVAGGATTIACPTGGATCTFNMSNKAIDVTVTFNAADLTVTKTHSGNFTVGVPASYTITVKNSGTASTSGTVTVTDVQPAGLTITGAAGSGWSCGVASGTATCSRATTLAAGSSYPAITLNVTPTAAGSITNTASVSGGNEANTANNTASDPTTVVADVDLTIDKSHSGDLSLGTNGVYTLTASNAGGTGTSGTVTVTDVLPAGLSFVSAAGAGWTCANASGTVTCTRTTAITAGGSAPNITLTVSVAEAAFPTVTNTASVSGGGEPAANNGNNSDSDPTTVVAPDLTIDKSHTGNFTQGVNGTYTLLVSNDGGVATTGTVTVSDVLPTGLGFSSAAGGGWTCGLASGTVTCTRTNGINAGSSAPAITLVVTVGAAAVPSVTNIASVSGGGEPAANNGNNSDSDPTTVVAGVDLTVDKSHTGSFTEGVNGVYSVVASNGGGTATAGTVTVTDALPTGLGFVSAAGTGWTCAFLTGTVTCTRTTAIAAGASAPAITLTVTVAAAAVPSVTNTASVSGGGEAAANNGNNSDSDPTTVVASNQPPVVEAGGPYTGNEASAIALSGASSNDPDAGDTPIYKWTYVANGTVDAGTSCSFSNDAVVQPTFTCNDDGAFTLTLKVDDQHGHIVQDNASVTVNNVKPTATAGGPYSGNEGSAIQLGGSGDDPAANDDDPRLTYKWTVNTTGIDVGGTCTFDDDTRKDAKVTCTDDGAFKVSLVATDDDGASSDASVADLTVANVKPVAHAGGPYSGNEGSDISLTGSATDVGGNDTFTYKWTADVTGIDAGGACSFGNDTHASTTVSCTDNGAFKVKLTVTDDDGESHFEEVALNVANVDPVADAGGSYTGDEGSPVQLNGSASDAGSNDTFTWAWESLNGPSVDAGATCSFSDIHAQNPTVTCTDDGEFKLTLTVKDDNNGQDSDDATLTLQNLKPVANAGGPYSGNEGTAVALNGSADDPGDNDNAGLTYKWTVNTAGIDPGGACTFDDDTKKDARVTCTDDSNGGTFALSLVATDDDGASSLASTATLSVANVKPVATAGSAYSGDEGSAIQLNGSADDAGDNDDSHLTYKWTLNTSGIDAGGSCSFDNDTKKDAKITCTDDSNGGTFTLSLVATDDDQGTSVASTTTLAVLNLKPVASAGGTYSGNEGSAIALSGSADDPGDNDDAGLTYKWTVTPTGIDGGGACSFDDDTKKNAQLTCTDDSNGSTFTLTLVATDDDNASSTGATTTVTVGNVKPLVATITKSDGSALPTTIVVAGTLTIKVPFGDAGSNDTQKAQIDCGEGAGYVNVSSGNDVTPGFLTACTFATVGVKTVKVKVADDDGAYDEKSFGLTVKYTFIGFSAPVDRPSTMNVSKAGQAIPLKWQLLDANGQPVINLTSVDIKINSLSCGGNVPSDLIEEYASGASGLKNMGGGNYQFNWKTPTNYAGSCKNIGLDFGGGYVEVALANFNFKS